MIFIHHLLLLIVYVYVATLVTADARLHFQEPDARYHDGQPALSDWVEKESAISWDALLRNINPPGTIRGFVAASPSTSNPNYFYTWTRDSALVMRVVVSKYNEEVKRLLHDYVASEIYHQVTPTQCGCLGEPKFNADGSGYDGSWGRPQNDGPANRAITMMLLADKSHKRFVEKTLVPAIYTDLDYTVDSWATPCFDLWEEVCGLHFYTLMVMRRALVDGAQFASHNGDSARAAAYAQTAEKVRDKLETFWSSSHLFVTQQHCGGVDKPSGLDISVLLAANHAGLPPFTPGSDKMLATAHALEEAFEELYPVNDFHPSHIGTAIGRYPEDTYDGYGTSAGNPWFLATAGLAELYYRAALEWQADRSSIAVNEVNGPFFARLLTEPIERVQGTLFRYGSSEFDMVINEMTKAADRFMATVQYHQRPNGSLSEQFNRYTGFEQGARDLTWSYASFITAADARNGHPIA